MCDICKNLSRKVERARNQYTGTVRELFFAISNRIAETVLAFARADEGL